MNQYARPILIFCMLTNLVSMFINLSVGFTGYAIANCIIFVVAGLTLQEHERAGRS